MFSSLRLAGALNRVTSQGGGGGRQSREGRAGSGPGGNGEDSSLCSHILCLDGKPDMALLDAVPYPGPHYPMTESGGFQVFWARSKTLDTIILFFFFKSNLGLYMMLAAICSFKKCILSVPGKRKRRAHLPHLCHDVYCPLLRLSCLALWNAYASSAFLHQRLTHRCYLYLRQARKILIYHWLLEVSTTITLKGIGKCAGIPFVYPSGRTLWPYFKSPAWKYTNWCYSNFSSSLKSAPKSIKRC